nr:ribonuclease H-like domain-containing protein [Tanacetum cinerariifolium]
MDYAVEGRIRKISAENSWATIEELARYEDEGWNDLDVEIEDTFPMACNFDVGNCSKLQENHEVDANLKLLRSLPSAWNNIALIMRNKSDLDTLNMDDLYNNLKVYESEIKGQSSSSSNSQNVAFVSPDNTSSTNETVNTAHSVSAASSNDQASTGSYADDVMFSFFFN